MADLVRVNYRKYDGTLHWNMTMRRLGEDEHGVWLGLPAGGTVRKGVRPLEVCKHALVIVFPRDAWWTAVFNAAPRPIETFVHVTTPPRWPSAAEVTMVDLDLDIECPLGERRPVLVDEDDFAEHRVRYAYPPEVVQRAEAAAGWLMKAVAAGAEPFDGTHLPWLKLVA